MFFSDFIRQRSEDIDFNSDGHIEIDIDSSMLHGVTVDTYGTFDGESWTEGVYEYASSIVEWLDYPIAGDYPTVDFDYDDIDFTYNFSKIIEKLSEAAGESLIDHYDFIREFKVNSTFSPGAYNFATDSFSATWTIDPEKIDEIIGDDFDPNEIESWARREYASRSGFISNIPRYFDNENTWAIIWATINRILIDGKYDGMWDVLETEYEAYEEGVNWELTESAYRKIFTTITGDEAPETITDENTLLEALPAYQDEVLFTV